MKHEILFLILLLTGCATATTQGTVPDSPKATVSCDELVKHAGALTDQLEASYVHNADIANAQDAGAVLTFVPPISLVAAAGTVLAGMGRVDTGALRTALDRARNRIDAMIIGNRCG